LLRQLLLYASDTDRATEHRKTRNLAVSTYSGRGRTSGKDIPLFGRENRQVHSTPRSHHDITRPAHNLHLPNKAAAAASRIRAGVGGWTFEPWRSNFFPPGLPHSRELEYASRQLSAIEVNGTYYGTLKPASFKKWHDETPDNFVFSLKASRYATNRRVLAEAGESIQRFTESGISELGGKLGPIVWQFMPGKVFEAGDFEAFLALLPDTGGWPGAAPCGRRAPRKFHVARLPGAGAPLQGRHGLYRR
jgi:hypothetical protein